MKDKTILSPFSENILEIKTRTEVLSFQNQNYEINYHYYEDEGIEFTTDELDNINLQQLYNQTPKA